MNVVLPKGIPPGRAPVVLNYRENAIGESSVEVTPGPTSAPRVVTVTDANNRLAEFQIECGTFKAILDDVANPDKVSFEIEGHPAQVSHRVCLNPLSETFYYTVPLPSGIGRGEKTLTIRASDTPLKPVHISLSNNFFLDCFPALPTSRFPASSRTWRLSVSLDRN